MQYSAKITNAVKGHSIEQKQDYLDISFDILALEEGAEEKVKVADRRLSFPLETTQEEILAELTKYCEMYEGDIDTSTKAAKEAEINAAADETIEALKGRET